MAKVANLKVDLQTGTTSTLYAAWTFSKKHLDYYQVSWKYYTGDGVAFDGGSSQVTLKSATYSIPSNARKVRVTVKPVSETYEYSYKSNGTTKTTTKKYWSGTAVSKDYVVATDHTPEQPSAPTVSISNTTLTVTLDTYDSNTTYVEFEVIEGTKRHNSGISKVAVNRASWTCSLLLGCTYRVRCRGIYATQTDNSLVSAVSFTDAIYGEWSEYSSDVSTPPSTVANVSCSADSSTSVKVVWDGISGVTGYTVEYTTNSDYFDSSSEVQSLTVTNSYAYVTGLDSGETWYFRVKATNDSGESGWSTIVSTVIGTTPEAPTTWSSTVTAVIGDTVNLYWVHNCEDGSDQQAAQVQITVNSESSTVQISDDQSYYSIDTSQYTDAEILWQVCTMGVTGEYGEWSTQREITVYEQPSVTLMLNSNIENKWIWDTFNFNTDTIYTAYSAEYLTGFPFYISATAAPETQTPISYYLVITAVEAYETESVTGETVIVSAGDEVYAKLFNVSDNPLEVTLSAGDLRVESGQRYLVTVTVSMDSGLTAEDSDNFTVDFRDETYEPDARVVIDPDLLCAYVQPFCVDEDEELIDDITLSVFRRETDGSFTELYTGLENNGSISITDPHPSLDYARYRIVAQKNISGRISYNDIPDEPINEPSLVFQWNESWDISDHDDSDIADIPPWTGNMLKLPYNIEISESYEADVSLVEYIGREHPVSYYGTQKGVSASWSTEIDKQDTQTLYALRKLAAWSGDVYVREPTGTGYWAQVQISMNIRYNELVIPVSINVTRVEGGI